MLFKNIKVCVVYIVAFVLCCFFSSCGIDSEEDELLLNQNKICVDDAETAFEAIKNHDKEALKELFCSKTADTHNIDDEIEKMYDFIDGDFESYNKISDPATGIIMENGEITRLNGGPHLQNVKTSTGHEYDIFVQVVIIYKKDESWEGVTQIGIIDLEADNSDDYYRIGEPFEY